MNFIETMVNLVVEFVEFNVNSGYETSFLSVLMIVLPFGLLGGALFLLNRLLHNHVTDRPLLISHATRIVYLSSRLIFPYPLSVITSIFSRVYTGIVGLLIGWKIYQITCSVFYQALMIPDGNRYFEAAVILTSFILIFSGLYLIRRFLWSDTDRLVVQIWLAIDDFITEVCQSIFDQPTADRISRAINRLRKVCLFWSIVAVIIGTTVVCSLLATQNILFGILFGMFFMAPVGYSTAHFVLIIINSWQWEWSSPLTWATTTN